MSFEGDKNKTASNVETITATACGYYDSENALTFNKQVWSGEHIHVGLYDQLEGDDAKLEGVPRITKASSLATQELLSRCFPPGGPDPSTCTIADLGSGYGGTARAAAAEYGCKVECIDIAKRQNAMNIALTKAAGLSDKVFVPGERSFFETGMPDACYDVVLSQDSYVHAGPERNRALGEAVRILKPGGLLVFTDLMQSEGADPKDLQAVYERLRLDDGMATPTSYEKWGKEKGLETSYTDMTDNFKIHYELVRGVLMSRGEDLKDVEQSFIDGMIRDFDACMEATRNDLLRWGFVVMRKKPVGAVAGVMTGSGEAISDLTSTIVAIAQGYYDSDNAFNFYRQVWGGEHIHVGLYDQLVGDDSKLEGVPRITKASSLATQELLSRCFPPGGPDPSTCTLADLGSGYGGTARAAAAEYGCKVVCINVSKRENGVNDVLTEAAGLSDKVSCPGEKSFFETGMPDASCDVVLSQDALLHAGTQRYRALGEAARILRPSGLMVFTDIMQSEEADPRDLQEVYNRIHLDDMATPTAYEKWGKDCGLEKVEYTDMTGNMASHYASVREVLVSRRGTLEGVEDSFVDNMARGLDAWTSAAGKDLVRWGYTVLRKS